MRPYAPSSREDLLAALLSNGRSDYEAIFLLATVFAQWQTPAVSCGLKEDAAAPFLCCRLLPQQSTGGGITKMVRTNARTLVPLCMHMDGIIAQELYCPTPVFWYQA